MDFRFIQTTELKLRRDQRLTHREDWNSYKKTKQNHITSKNVRHRWIHSGIPSKMQRWFDICKSINVKVINRLGGLGLSAEDSICPGVKDNK